ncbi:hypothetical protein [Microbacterium dextranolyticum]|uniref:Uncharacterized protein n=1 Tax=Microbacterium dextranolyticum TaxID=36806 RepID=A0A9W6HNT0_9MICO|nr:hypothetical protein [Microbacterium dextranolyticum]MBM7462659.1 hypothetical protein [Microbacterium dextranolyticum]GLJ96237.1 hypothetical protein GCM10017591_23000 [Microbacterium dextranolyticum]
MTDEKYAPESAETPQDSAAVTSVPEETPDPDVTFASVANAFAAATDGPDGVDQSAPPQYGVGPFSVREVALGGVWVVAFIVSFFPIFGELVGSRTVWSGGIDWVLTIGTPTVAVFLLLLRRLSPQGIRRVGSLGIDQFASVAFSVSAIIWLGILWSAFVSLAGQRLFVATWVVWVEFILMLAGVLLTVFAPLFPTIGEDFRHRPEVVAHRFASPARPVVARPVTERPTHAAAPAATAPTEGEPSSSVSDETVAFSPQDTAAVAEVISAPPASQAFWALAPVDRAVVDDAGQPLFTIGPTAWALVIEDRGDSFVVRHEDGRIGYLTDVSGVTRG